jgi:hypothetical protein
MDRFILTQQFYMIMQIGKPLSKLPNLTKRKNKHETS